MNRNDVVNATSSRLDEFYSSDIVDTWKVILGDRMHYHHGFFDDNDPVETWSDIPFNRAVDELTQFIHPGSTVYDLGCGWGGPAVMLTAVYGCNLTGITISKTQYQYCHSLGLKVLYGDMTNTTPPDYFDNLLLLESLEHVKDKVRFLRQLRKYGKQIVIRMSCKYSSTESGVFGGTMYMISSDEFRSIFEKSGWSIIHWKNRREEALPSSKIWNERMKAVPKQDDFHFEILRNFCKETSTCPTEWGKYNPLIEVVAI